MKMGQIYVMEMDLSIGKVGKVNSTYKVTLVVEYLGWVDLCRVRQVVTDVGLVDMVFDYPPPSRLGSRQRQKWHASWGKSSHQCQPKPGPRQPASPCIWDVPLAGVPLLLQRTGAGNITSHGMRETGELICVLFTYCRQEFAILSAHIHATNGMYIRE